MNYDGLADVLMSHHVEDVAKGIRDLAGGSLSEENVDVHLWRYRYYGERQYVANLCALLTHKLESWLGMYMVHHDAIRWERAILPFRFRYMDRPESVYVDEQVRWGSGLLCRQ